MTSDFPILPPFSAPYAPEDGALAVGLLAAARFDDEAEKRIDRTATRLIDEQGGR